MNNGKTFKVDHSLAPDLQAIATMVSHLAKDCQGDSLKLLALLRLLEALHHDIRDTLFQDSLPDNRQALYNLLKDIEATGGWPYIHRMKLQALLTHLQTSADGDTPVIPTSYHPRPNDSENKGSF